MSAYAKCHDCGWEQHGYKTLEQAQQLATLHYRLGGCLLAFGYEEVKP